MLRLLTWPLRVAFRVLFAAACAVALLLGWAALPSASTAAVRVHLLEPVAAGLRLVADGIDPPGARPAEPAPDRSVGPVR